MGGPAELQLLNRTGIQRVLGNAVVNGGAVFPLVNLLSCGSMETAEHAVCALNAIAGDCVEYKDDVVLTECLSSGICGPPRRREAEE